MPWGADPSRFTVQPTRRLRHVVLVGDHAEDESHGELLFAASHNGFRVRHVSPHPTLCRRRCTTRSSTDLLCTRLPDRSTPCDYYDHVGSSDETLVHELQTAMFASALRKFEGFEMIGVEALFCGARPLVYSINEWYQTHAVVVRSGLSPSDLFYELLRAISLDSYRPISDEEMQVIHGTYAWPIILPRMFEHIRRRV